MKGDKGSTCPVPEAFLEEPLMRAEFAGTLLGFDDYVSKFLRLLNHENASLTNADMVLEDVIELYVWSNMLLSQGITNLMAHT